MREAVLESFKTILAMIPHETEFWSAIAGAIVGGVIAYLVQIKALREGRRQRNEDRKELKLAQAHALLFKIIRIHAGFFNVSDHIESCFARAKKDGFEGEPWQFVIPMANFPDPVHFSAEEMGMLLALKNDDLFNVIAPMDVVHNSLIEAFRVLSKERRALAQRLRPDNAHGELLRGTLDRQQFLELRPYMIEVNSLVAKIREDAAHNFELATDALDRLQNLFREKLGLQVKLEFKTRATKVPGK